MKNHINVKSENYCHYYITVWKAALIDATIFYASFTVYATTGNVATAAVVIDFIAMAAVAIVTAADSIGTYAVFSMAMALALSQLLLIIIL